MIKIKVFYIQEADKPYRIRKIFNIIKIERTKIILPILAKETNSKDIEKIFKKINKNMKKYDAKYLVLSKKLKENKVIKDEVEKQDIKVLDGKWLWQYMVYDTINYIINKKKIKKEEIELSILVNNLTKEVVENIKKFVTEFRRINIVTNHIEDFKVLEEKIYNQYGIMITVTNNLKKSLTKSRIILNVDFVNESLNKYNMYENAIIVNLEGNIKINKKRFNGIVINDFEIKSKRMEEYFSIEDLKNFYVKDLLEAEIICEDLFKNVEKRIHKGLFEIEKLYTINGVL